MPSHDEGLEQPRYSGSVRRFVDQSRRYSRPFGLENNRAHDDASPRKRDRWSERSSEGRFSDNDSKQDDYDAVDGRPFERETWRDEETPLRRAGSRRSLPRQEAHASLEAKESKWDDDNFSAAPSDEAPHMLLEDHPESGGSSHSLGGMASAKKKRVRPLVFVSVLSVPFDDDPKQLRKVVVGGGPGEETAAFAEGGPSLLKCFIERKKSLLSGCELTLRLDGTSEVLLVAQKAQASGNYHIYDVSRGTLGRKLMKKGGNYLGKLAAASPTEPMNRILVDHKTVQERSELALFVHRKCTAVSAMVDGAKPRQICVALPRKGPPPPPPPQTLSEATHHNHHHRNLLKRFLVSDPHLDVLEQKQPRLINGQYSLNFFGRATVASVKNLQLVDHKDRVCFQFGKISNDSFNLDFAEPLTPFVAFALAVSQFVG